MSKKIALLVLLTLLAISTVACAAEGAIIPGVQAALATTTQIESPAAPHTITVVGEGEVSLEPDMATINVGAEARADTVSEAKAEVEARMATITTVLQEMDIAKRDIQTSHYGIHYEREPMLRMPEGPAPEIQEAYNVSNMVRVTVRDVDKAGDVLDAVVKAGANQVHGVTYTVSDKTAWQSQARAKAMTDARNRAQELAELAEVELGEVLSISEIIGGMLVPTMRIEGGMGGGGGIAPGELEFATQIQVTFAAQ